MKRLRYRYLIATAGLVIVSIVVANRWTGTELTDGDTSDRRAADSAEPSACGLTVRVSGRRAGAPPAPCPGALVSVSRTPRGEGSLPGHDRVGDSGAGRYSTSKTTASDGQAIIGAMPEGEFIVVARAAGFVGTECRVSVDPTGSEPLETVLDACAVIRGTLLDRDGALVEGAEVNLLYESHVQGRLLMLHPDDAVPARMRSQVTTAGGAFGFGAVLPATGLEVLFVKRGTGRALIDVEALGAGEVKDLEIILDPETCIKGRVPAHWLASGRGSVECFHQKDNAYQLIGEQRVIVEDAAEFLLANLDPGRKTLVASWDDGGISEVCFVEVDAPSGLTTDVGQLTVRDSTIQVTAEIEEGDGQNLRIDARGRIIESSEAHRVHPIAFRVDGHEPVQIRGAPGGKFQLSAGILGPDGPDPRWESASITEPYDGSSAAYRLVFKKANSRPGAAVRVVVRCPPGIGAEALDARVTPMRDGRIVKASGRKAVGMASFGLGRQDSGAYRLHVVANGFRSGAIPFDVGEGDAVTVEVDSWAKAVAVEGEVIDKSGEAMSDVLVHVEGVDGRRGWTVSECRTDSDGRFRISGLPAIGRLWIRASWAGGWTSRVAVGDGYAHTGLVLVEE